MRRTPRQQMITWWPLSLLVVCGVVCWFFWRRAGSGTHAAQTNSAELQAIEQGTAPLVNRASPLGEEQHQHRVESEAAAAGNQRVAAATGRVAPSAQSADAAWRDVCQRGDAAMIRAADFLIESAPLGPPPLRPAAASALSGGGKNLPRASAQQQPRTASVAASVAAAAGAACTATEKAANLAAESLTTPQFGISMYSRCIFVSISL